MKNDAQRAMDIDLTVAPEYADSPTFGFQQPLVFATHPLERWDAYFLKGKQIGYSSIRSDFAERGDEMRYRIYEKIRVREEGQPHYQELTQTTVETTTGQLKSFEAVKLENGARATCRGKVVGNQLKIATTIDGAEPSEREIRWRPNYGGLMALHQDLLQNPMKVGEKRKLTVLAPLLYEIGELRLEAIGESSISMLDGENLIGLEIESKSFIDDKQVYSMTLWVDSEGNILKQFAPDLGLIILRTDRETATQYFDTAANAKIPLASQIDQAQNLLQAGYMVKSKHGTDLRSLIGEFPGQRVRIDESGNAQIAVLMDRLEDQSSSTPTESDKSANSFIQSGNQTIKKLSDSSVKRLSRGAATEEKTTIASALELSKATYSYVVSNSNGLGLDTAVDVATNRRGGITAHALLLAAMCRAQGIPARIAAGVVYDMEVNQPVMRYHVWTLAFADEKWIHLDASRMSGLAAADRIVLATDDLSSGSLYTIGDRVADLIEDLEVEVRKSVPGELASLYNTTNGVNRNSAPKQSKNRADSIEELLKSIDLDGPGGAEDAPADGTKSDDDTNR